jgi:hypothetical protein
MDWDVGGINVVLGCVKMLIEVEMEAGISHAPSSKFCMRNISELLLYTI